MRWIKQLQSERRAWTLALLVLGLVGQPAPAGSQQTSAQSTSPQPAFPAAAQPPSPQLPSSPPSIPAAIPPRPPELRFVVVLDAAHGGSDAGAILGIAGPEKNYTEALAVRLHALLGARGVRSIFTRDGDVTLDNDARAIVANRAHASACILLHATPTGNGVHLFTSSLPAPAQPAPQDLRRAFLPWQTAQASFATQSLRLESDINAALTALHVPVLLGRTSLMPLDSMACPAVAIEIAPLNAETPLGDPKYQQKITEALTSALLAWRSDWRSQP